MYRPYLNNIDKNKRILEIGPLCRPMIRKNEGFEVFYADIRSTDEIKEFYKNDQSVDNAGICEIDFVVKDSYFESFRGIEKFDYVIASHVIEHVPQLILFFEDIASVINPGGFLCLTIPDKRYCFDHFRIPTSFAEAFDIFTQGVKNHPMRVLDFMYNITPSLNDPVLFWNAEDYTEGIENTYPFDKALHAYEKALNGGYLDAHFSVFTPESFLLLLYNMTRASLLPFKCVEFYATQYNTLEFNVVLQLEESLLSDNNTNSKELALRNLVDLMRLNKNDEKKALVNEISALKNEKSALMSENSALMNEKNVLINENSALENERSVLENEKGVLVNEIDLLQGGINRLKVELYEETSDISRKIRSALKSVDSGVMELVSFNEIMPQNLRGNAILSKFLILRFGIRDFIKQIGKGEKSFAQYQIRRHSIKKKMNVKIPLHKEITWFFEYFIAEKIKRAVSFGSSNNSR